MNTLITGLAMFSLAVGVVLILIWHKNVLRRRTQEFKSDREMWKARTHE